MFSKRHKFVIIKKKMFLCISIWIYEMFAVSDDKKIRKKSIYEGKPLPYKST